MEIIKEKISQVKEYLEENKEKFCWRIIAISWILLIYRFISLITLALVGLILISIVLIIKEKLQKVYSVGFINFLSPRLQTLLLERSIFDVLMDLWYFPTISEYIKMLVKPFIYKISPEEATLVLRDFDPNVRKFFLTKGIVNVLPTKVRDLVMPHPPKPLMIENPQAKSNLIINHISGENDHVSTDDLSNGSNRNYKEAIKVKGKIKDKHVSFTLQEDEKVFSDEEIKFKKAPKSPEITRRSSERVILKEVDVIKEDELDERLNDDLKAKKVVTLINKKNFQENESHGGVQEDEDYDAKFEIFDSEQGKLMIKTKVLSCSNNNKKFSLSKYTNNHSSSSQALLYGDSNIANQSTRDLRQFKWDGIHLYYKREEEMKKKEAIVHSPKINIFGVIKETLMKRISNEKATKVGAALLISLLIQILLFKGARSWTFSLLKFVIFIATSIGITGALYFFGFRNENELMPAEPKSERKSNKA